MTIQTTTETETKLYPIFRHCCEEVDQLVFNCKWEYDDDDVPAAQQARLNAFKEALLKTVKKVEEMSTSPLSSTVS